MTENLTGCKMEGMEPSVPSMELDGPTQEFSLGTPRVRGYYQEPRTPEMPELSSVTQDICKVSPEFANEQPSENIDTRIMYVSQLNHSPLCSTLTN